MSDLITRKQQDEQLTIYDPRITKLSTAMRWKPATTLRRVTSALPTIPEQTIYLVVAANFGLRPESFAKILKSYMGDRKLTAEQMEPPSAIFSSFVEFLAAVLDLLKVQATDYPGLSLSIEYATQIVSMYGTEHYDLFFAMLEANLPQLRALCGLSEDASYANAMSRATWYMLKFVIPRNRAAGIPDILSLNLPDEASKKVKHSEASDVDDPLEMSAEELRNTDLGRELKSYGVL